MSVSSTTIALDRFTTFGDLLRYLRRRAGYTQRELSIAVGYSDTQISRLEHNERLPDLATLTARFLPVLDLEDQPEVAARLLELAATVRREDAPAAGLPPYKGLRYFDEADAELFFGREALTARLVDRLRDQLASGRRFLAVVGASGSGKSSVVRAGLIPALRWQQPSSGWPVLTVTPTAHPLEALAAALCGETTRQALPTRRLLDSLTATPQGLHDALQHMTEAVPVAHGLLVVDQFEELFTLCRSADEQDAFVENLMTAALYPLGRGIIVIVLRADFYGQCARFDALRQALAQHQEYIGPMSNEELRRAITAPAARDRWELEDGLVELLLHDVGADPGHLPEPGALPLLSHALLATWQRRRGRALTLSGYTATGGVRGAIAETAEAVFYDELDRQQREIARQIFLRLTTLGEDATAAGTRRRVTIDELIGRPEDRESVHAVLSALADARLVTTDENTAEVAHEALIREWSTLRGWLEEDREGLRLHRHLTDAAQGWDALERDPGSLYRGARLVQALEWAAAYPERVNALEQAFLDASQALTESEAAEREAQRRRELEAARKLAEAERARAEEEASGRHRLRQRAAMLAAALIVAGLLAVAALVAARQALAAQRVASSRELAAAAATNLEIDAERSLLLALEALERADTLEARNALHQALPALHLLRTLPAHTNGAVDVTFSPDGTRLASIGDDRAAKVWDAGTGELLLTLQDEAPELSSSVAFSPDGRVLATGWVTKIILWDATTGAKLATFTGESVGTTIGYNLGTGQLSFSPDGQRLAVANLDGASRVWELATQREMLSLAPPGLPAKALDYSPDGTRLATAGDEGIVTVWDAGDGTERFAVSLGGIIHSVTFSPDGALLAAAGEDGGVKVWDAAWGEERATLPRLSGLYDVTFLADGTLATAGQDGTARVWDPLTGQELLTLASATSTVIGVAGSADGSRIATSSYDGTLRLWDAAPGHELLTVRAHEGIVWAVAYAPDGSAIATASVDGTAKLWDPETGRLLRTFRKGSSPTDGFTGLAFSPDGRQLATGGIDGTTTLWDSETGEPLRSLPGHTNMVVGLAFSGDGTRLASGSWDSTAKVWDVITGEEITAFSGHTPPALVVGLAFSPDGRTVFTGADDDFVRQWDAASGEEIRTFSGSGKDVYGVALSPDGETLVMSDQDGMITMWDLAMGEQRHTFSAHAGIIARLTYSPDGARVATGGFDGLAKVWDARTGEELFTLYGNLSNVFGVAFSPDGTRLATAGADGTLRTFTLDLDELVALAETRVTRGLTAEECRKFLHADHCP